MHSAFINLRKTIGEFFRMRCIPSLHRTEFSESVVTETFSVLLLR